MAGLSLGLDGPRPCESDPRHLFSLSCAKRRENAAETSREILAARRTPPPQFLDSAHSVQPSPYQILIMEGGTLFLSNFPNLQGRRDSLTQTRLAREGSNPQLSKRSTLDSRQCLEHDYSTYTIPENSQLHQLIIWAAASNANSHGQQRHKTPHQGGPRPAHSPILPHPPVHSRPPS